MDNTIVIKLPDVVTPLPLNRPQSSLVTHIPTQPSNHHPSGTVNDTVLIAPQPVAVAGSATLVYVAIGICVAAVIAIVFAFWWLKRTTGGN